MFFLVDAFCDVPFKGNPAGVYIVGEYPEDSEMQKIARYYNWSETAFVKKLGENEFYIRWFSPLDEAPLCGHATLASAHILFSKGLVSGNVINFKYNSGELKSTKNGELITMSFPAKPVQKCSSFPFSVNKVVGIKSYKEAVKDELGVFFTKENFPELNSPCEDVGPVLRKAIKKLTSEQIFGNLFIPEGEYPLKSMVMICILLKCK